MSQVLVAAAAVNQTPLAWDDNLGNIRLALSAARKANAQVLCLPELCISGYGCEDAFLGDGVLREALESAVSLARDTKGLVANFGLPLLVHGMVYNVVAVAVDGRLRGFVAKQNLAGDGLHYEPRWFKPWPRGVVTSVAVGNEVLPVGDILFEVSGVRLGFEICEDAWVADRPAFALAQSGVDIILNPSASHFAFGKQDIRKRLILEGSRACGAGYLYANLLGCEAGRAIYDGDTFIASHGEIVNQGARFSFQEYQLTTGVVDIARSRLMRRQRSGFTPRMGTTDRCVIVPDFKFKLAETKQVVKRSASRANWEQSSEIKHEEFTRAIALGLFDYLRKSLSHGFVVSLSGGVDSSAVSCLVALMVQASVAELGLKGVFTRLSYIPWVKKVKSESELLRNILACVYQATRNSSELTHRAALSLAQEIGASVFDLKIDSIVTSYQDLIEEATGVQLSWGEHDLALQNIQARVRSPSVWLIANLRRALLLTTSNRSEAAVGYTTMDGDSSGGLAPLGGIDKAYLREWLRWLELTGPSGLRAFASLKLVNKQPPTAELRPKSAKQTDEGDLMPYVVLDSIERGAVRDKLTPLEVWNQVCELYTGELSSSQYSKLQLAAWVERFFTLWSASQWKRERYAPSFHVDDENVDPKTWCRFPILSGGFRKELAALRSVAKRIIAQREKKRGPKK
jgi:NAD+ synthase (glutamine-hydrolysing)